MIVLTKKQDTIVRLILSKYIPSAEVWVFGSRVTSTVKPHSDLDLAIKNHEPLSIETMAFLKDAFSESDLPFKVDVVEWATISDNFRRIIRDQHAVFQERSD